MAVISAMAAAVLTWAIAVPIVGVGLAIRTGRGGSGSQTVGLAAVIAVSLLACLLGWGALAVLERRTARAGSIWTVTAAVALLLSLTGPITSAVGPASQVSLLALHLSVAAVLIPLLRRTVAPRR